MRPELRPPIATIPNEEFALRESLHMNRSRPAWRVLCRAAFCVVALLVAVALLTPAPNIPADAPSRLIAIADVHGDYEDFCAILQRVQLIDEQRHWSGGNATFVQVGDLIDRGPQPREVLDLMMSLDEQSAKAGGRVVAILGNHEVMNLMGDLRYVTAGNYASFADNDSEKRRQTAFQKYMDWRKSHPHVLAELSQPVLPETEAEWMSRHPMGFVEQRDAFSPKGTYGKWLRQRSAIAKVGSIIFLHGGINPDLTLSPDQINERIHSELNQYDEIRQSLTDDTVLLPFFTLQEAVAVAQAELIAEQKHLAPTNDARKNKLTQFLGLGGWLSVREDGPLWFRGYDQWKEEEGLPKAEKILAAYHVTNIVVGHTVQRTAHIRPVFGGRILLIDTGMLSSYYKGGKPSALEIGGNGKFTAVYLDQQSPLQEAQAQPVQSAPPKDH